MNKCATVSTYPETDRYLLTYLYRKLLVRTIESGKKQVFPMCSSFTIYLHVANIGCAINLWLRAALRIRLLRWLPSI